MNLWGWSARSFKVEHMPASCKIYEGYVSGSIREISRSGMSMEIRTSRIPDGLNDMLNKPISLTVENVILEGTISWYTVEGSSYFIGITVSRKQLPAWRKIFANSVRAEMHAATKPASV